MKDNFLLKQLAQAVIDSHYYEPNEYYLYCAHCSSEIGNMEPHKPHCIVLVAEQILKGDEE